MRTTLRLNDALLDRARREAVRRGITLTALMEEGLRLALARPTEPPVTIVLPVCQAQGGTLPGVDLNDSASLHDRVEGV